MRDDHTSAAQVSRRRRGGRLAALVATLVLAACASSATGSSAPGSTTPLPSGSGPATGGGATTGAAGGGVATSTTSAAGARSDPAAGPGTLPPGSALPSDEACAARVSPTAEVRAANAPFNQRAGRQKNIPEKWLDRVTGAYTGTTDEILQWGACKWGIDPDIARAQAAKESYWNMQTYGDFGADPAACPPGHALGADGKKGECPQSIGILQIRYPYHGPPANRPTWPEAAESTAYNVDYTYALWRSCYEGDLTWLNTTEHTGTYAAGDAWGCLGVWFAGRWHTPEADGYIDAVRTYDRQQIWRTDSFRNAG